MSFVLVLPAAILLPALVLPHAAVPKVEAHAASRGKLHHRVAGGTPTRGVTLVAGRSRGMRDIW